MSTNDLTIEGLLRAHAPHAPESLRERVFALEPKGRRRLSLPPRRLVLIALPAALGIAVSAAVVHGIIGSGSSTPTALQQHLVAGVTAPQDAASPPTWRSASGSAGSAHMRALGPVAKSFATPTIGSRTRLQHTDASMQLSVKN